MQSTLKKTISASSQTDLKPSEFDKIRRIVYDFCGINLHEGKQALVRGRLMKRLRALQLGSFSEYLDYIERDERGEEFGRFIDILTTNKTSFFRESSHYDYMVSEIIPKLGNRSVKWWSAGCSSGEEPMTMAMLLKEGYGTGGNPPVKILATDLSSEVVQYAKQGIYTSDKLKEMPDYYLKKYFSKIPESSNSYEVKTPIKNLITYGRLNLLKPWPMKGPFQIIMCRNVMIYFDKETQRKLVERFYHMLEPGGYLFVGHSESVTNKDIGFRTILPAAYQKIGK
ncbi:MAG: protein-glutamate O-methyltransferase [Balneolia bacterium]|nr:protein-glutamate O-methyltransferase [Balneolia bacterium]